MGTPLLFNVPSPSRQPCEGLFWCCRSAAVGVDFCGRKLGNLLHGGDLVSCWAFSVCVRLCICGMEAAPCSLEGRMPLLSGHCTHAVAHAFAAWQWCHPMLLLQWFKGDTESNLLEVVETGFRVRCALAALEAHTRGCSEHARGGLPRVCALRACNSAVGSRWLLLRGMGGQVWQCHAAN